MGLDHYLLGQVEKAEEHFRLTTELEQTGLARQLRPDDMELLFDHIRALIDFRQYEEALHLLDSLETDRLLDTKWTVELARSYGDAGHYYPQCRSLAAAGELGPVSPGYAV